MIKSRIRIGKRTKSRMKSKIMKRQVLAANMPAGRLTLTLNLAPHLIPNLHHTLSPFARQNFGKANVKRR